MSDWETALVALLILYDAPWWSWPLAGAAIIVGRLSDDPEEGGVG